MTDRVQQFEWVETWDPDMGHVAEILKDGKAFFEDIPGHKTRFAFGPKKANWILTFLVVVKDFVNSEGRLPGTEDDPKSMQMLGITLNWHARFTKSGVPIPHPYLELRKGKYSIGFGRQKAGALLEFENKLRQFARND
jgi:hypothetical protein